MNATDSKANAVREMFTGIAHRYDFLNHFLSLGIDKRWRKKAVAEFGDVSNKKYLDIACGTCDLSVELASRSNLSTKITAADFSEGMLEIGASKVANLKLSGTITVEHGDALNLKYENDSFDGTMCAFGVRNFADVARGLNEMSRVIKSGGRVVILEFTTPQNRIIASLYKLYFTKILPTIGGIVSGKKSAYSYLPDSVYKFPTAPNFSKMMEDAGFTDIVFTPLTFGICGIHTGVKS